MSCCTSRRHFAQFSGFWLLLTLLIPSASAQQAALVSVDPIIEQQFTQTVPILGRLVAKRSGAIASRISGAVTDVMVAVGDRVSEGQVLARVDQQNLQLRQLQAESQLAESQTRLKTAKAQLALATQDVKRLKGLADSASVSKAAYDDAKQQQNIAFARVNEAEASINSSRANLDLATLNLTYVEIKAPFDGTITEKLTEVGNYLQPGVTVFEIISDSNLELEADIPASLLGGLVRGESLQLKLENGSTHQAELRAIIPEENPRTRTRRVRFHTTLNEDAGELASQQSVTVFVPASAAKDILSVHKDAVIQRGNNRIVYVATGSEPITAERRPIKTGAATGQRLEVLEGLEVGERVVIRGNEQLKPGQAISVADAE